MNNNSDCHGYIFMLDYENGDINDVMEYGFLLAKQKTSPFISYLSINKSDMSDISTIKEEDIQRWQQNLIKGQKMSLYKIAGKSLENVDGLFEDMIIQIKASIIRNFSK